MTTKQSIEIPPRTWLVWAIGLNALIATTRILALSASPLNLLPDEAQYWSWSRHLAFGYFSKPPMIAWLIAVTTHFGEDRELWVRLASPVLHACTGVVIAVLGRSMFSARVGFLASILYATLPGVTFSGLVISTDAPLLFFWSLALLASWQLSTAPSAGWAMTLGAAIGLGFLSKYAMGYFVLGLVLYLGFTSRLKLLAVWRWFAIAIVIGLAVLAPNLVWNSAHGWATVSHTAANADWGSGGLHLEEAGRFAAAQFGVFGPILLTVLAVRVVFLRRQPPSDAERFLLGFAVPVLVLMIVQAGISRAHANWAAVSYVSATLLVAGWLDAVKRVWAITLSLGLQLVVFAMFTLYYAGAIATPLPRSVDILHQMRGWQSLANMAWRKMASMPFGTTLAADDREVMAELDYYMRGRGFSLAMATGRGPAGNQYALEDSITIENGRHVLLIARYPDRRDILERFASHSVLEAWTISAGRERVRRFTIYDLSGFGDD